MKDIANVTTPVALLIAGVLFIILASLDTLPIGNPQPAINQSANAVFALLGFLCIFFAFVIAFVEAIGPYLRARRKTDNPEPDPIPAIQGEPKLFASEIANALKSDISWAAFAFDKANLRLAGQYSLFLRRYHRFKSEKQFLAGQFANLLLERCKHHIVKNHKIVYLIIDSGTTLFPFFEAIAEECKKNWESGEEWIKQLIILTNNFSGVASLIESGLKNPDALYPELAVTCHLLPGTPLPSYSALVGEETEDALKRFRNLDNKSNNAVFISLLTGSWIRIEKSDAVCPLPLARGDDQISFKQKILEFSNEIYVIAPLGKIFLGRDIDFINNILKPKGRSVSGLGSKQYAELKVKEIQKAKTVKLVSTVRIRTQDILYPHSIHTLAFLEDLNKYDIDAVKRTFHSDSIENIHHLLFNYNCPSLNEDQQKEIEFPDKETRDRLILEFAPHVLDASAKMSDTSTNTNAYFNVSRSE